MHRLAAALVLAAAVAACSTTTTSASCFCPGDGPATVNVDLACPGAYGDSLVVTGSACPALDVKLPGNGTTSFAATTAGTCDVRVTFTDGAVYTTRVSFTIPTPAPPCDCPLGPAPSTSTLKIPCPDAGAKDGG